jgi:hypothetical protein
VAYAVNPFILPPLLVMSILALHDAPRVEIGLAGGICLTFLAAAPLLAVCCMAASGRTNSIEVPERQARTLPYVVGFLGSVASLAGLLLLVETARALVLAVSVLLCVNTALLGVINLRWKISLHAAGASAFVAILLFAVHFSAPETHSFLPAWTATLIPLVMWARVRGHTHTSGEVWAGATFGIVVPLLELSTLAATGHLYCMSCM